MSIAPSETDNAERISRFALLFLVLADLGLIGLYILSVVADRLAGIQLVGALDLNYRYGLASTYNYSKYFVAAAFLLSLAFFHRRAGYVWLAALFLFFLADDALELHDKIGHSIGAAYDIGFLGSMSMQNRGEPIVYLGMLAMAVALLAGARRSMDGPYRRVWWGFAIAVAALAMFGAGVDVVHGVILDLFMGEGDLAGFVDTLFIVVEDGGEGIVATAIVWLALDGMLNAVRAGGATRITPVVSSAA